MANNEQKGMKCNNTDEAVAALVKQCADFDYVRFVLCSIVGEAYTKLVPARHAARFLKAGCRLLENVVLMGTGSEMFDDMYDIVGTRNIALIPKQGTAYPLPWATQGKYKVGAVLCEQVNMETGLPVNNDPRYLARQQLQRLQDLGYNICAGTEVKVILMDKTKEKPINDRFLYCTVTSSAKMEDFLYSVEEQLHKSGVDIENMSQEHSPGQFEFVLATSLGIEDADRVFKTRQALREIADKHGMLATFMTMLYPGVANETQYSHSIVDRNNRNLFYDSSRPDRLSDFARHWLGGLIKHMPALTALCCPTINCYRRIGEPFAGAMVNWGVDDRFASLRIRNNTQNITSIENRIPGGAANPYIVLAATIAAGLDGLEKKMECPPAATRDEAKEVLPQTLVEALEALKADETMCKALGETFIEAFLKEKTGSQLPVFPDWRRDDNSEEQFAKEREFFMKYI